MAIRLGDIAPDFEADTTMGLVSFHDWKRGSWAILFSHPKDFTPVCTTELGRAAALKGEFDRRNTRLIGLSVDSVESHERWAADIADVTGFQVNFPMIGDPDRRISALYDMIHPNVSDTLTVRSVFVVGPDNRVKLTFAYPASTGRSFDEILRILDALQLSADYSVATPVDWRQGDEVVIAATVSDEDARRKFPKGFVTKKPYFRVTPQPNLQD
jgi:alkyl hydroperoxide reductase subunit AhpC